MDFTKLLPPGSAPVSTAAVDETAIDDMSIGEVAYVVALFQTVFAQRMADPATITQVAPFTTAPGADWSGHQPAEQLDAAQDNEHAATNPEPSPTKEASGTGTPPAQPVAPENFYDSLPGIAHMLRHAQQAADAGLTHFAAHIDAALANQDTYLGTPNGVKGYNDVPQYLREVLRLSTTAAKKVADRLPYVTWTPGKSPESAAFQPAMVKIAKSFADGNIPGDNIDRIIGLDQDLTKYVHKTRALPEDKAAVMAAFEPALVDAAETATPDELSKAKSRWADRIAHALDADGPPVAATIRKQADNALWTKNMADGSGKIGIHATPEVYTLFKNWSLHQLNFNGTPVQVPQPLIDLLNTNTEPGPNPQPGNDHGPNPNTESGSSAGSDPGTGSDTGTESAPAPDPADAFDDINDLKTTPNPDAAAADSNGNQVPADEVAGIDQLSTGQRLAAIVIGMFHNLLTMDPTELGAKKAHGASAQLMIVQDVDTAYHTLGVGALPEAVRRPPGPAGVLPPIITAPNPEHPDTPVCLNPDHTTGYSPPSWTQYMSEAVNIGPLHPKHTTQLACDSKLVAQIWDTTHDVLAQHRAHRLFTPAQRRAILARDRGCQAPGCTVPAVYCQIHHITERLNGGPTDVDNAITLCAHHHGAVHNSKWTIRKHHGITFFQPAPWLDPTQPLLRNLYWSL